jgi:hypothetical protein
LCWDVRGQRLQPVVQVSGALPRPPFAEQVGVQGTRSSPRSPTGPRRSPLFRKTSCVNCAEHDTTLVRALALRPRATPQRIGQCS